MNCVFGFKSGNRIKLDVVDPVELVTKITNAYKNNINVITYSDALIRLDDVEYFVPEINEVTS